MHTEAQPPPHLDLSRLAQHYGDEGNRSMQMLCLLASLASAPRQESVYSFVRANLENWEAERSTVPFLLPTSTCLVSVIMATRNRADIIEHSVRSVLAQTLADFELIVVNDGGCDDTEGVLARFGSDKIRYIRTDHGGPSTARNHALRESRGKYICYLDDDDVFFPDFLETMVGFVVSHDAEFACARCLLVSGEWNDGHFIEKSHVLSGQPTPERLRHGGVIPPSLTVIHSRASLLSVGIFDEGLLQGEDWDFWNRYARRYPLQVVDVVSGEYRLTPRSTTASQVARTKLFADLLRTYFVSEFGRSIIAVSAHQLGRVHDASAIVRRFFGKLCYLSDEQIALVLGIALSDGASERFEITRRLQTLDPDFFPIAWFSVLRARGPRIAICHLPGTALVSMIIHSIRHPRCVVRRSPNLMRPIQQFKRSAYPLYRGLRRVAVAAVASTRARVRFG